MARVVWRETEVSGIKKNVSEHDDATRAMGANYAALLRVCSGAGEGVDFYEFIHHLIFFCNRSNSVGSTETDRTLRREEYARSIFDRDSYSGCFTSSTPTIVLLPLPTHSRLCR